MNDPWPFCVTIGCHNAYKDLSGEPRRRYATDEGNDAQRDIYFLGSFVEGKADETICLCTSCWQVAQNAGTDSRGHNR